MTSLLALTALFVGTSLAAASWASPLARSDGPRDVPEEAQQEIQRRGAMVERIGPSAEARSGDRLAEALAPPPDDSHKWFLTLIVQRDCPACERMRADFERAPPLAAWVCPADPQRSWAHWQVFQADDASQAWRWQDVPLSQFPTVIVQPPLNRAFGDPHAVVYLHQGYLAPEELSVGIRRAIQRYVAKLASARKVSSADGHGTEPPPPRGSMPSRTSPVWSPSLLEPRSVSLPANAAMPTHGSAEDDPPRHAAQDQPEPQQRPQGPDLATDEATGRGERDAGQSPGEWKPPVAPPPRLEPLRLVPNLPPEPAPGLTMLLVQLVTALVSGQGTGNVLLLAILIWQVWRHLAKARGIPLLVSDELASQLLAALRAATPADAAQSPKTPQDAARS
jgi:hypothetical protein